MTLPAGSQQCHGPDEGHAQRPAEIGLGAVSVRTLFRSLGRCVERGYRESLSGALFEHVTATRGLVLCLYDLTTLYFEAEREDDLRRVGYSKEAEPDRKSVV